MLLPKLLPALITAAVIIVAAPGQAQAAEGFSVTPMRFDNLTIRAGNSKTVTITIVNAYDTTRTFRLSTQDIKGSKDPGQNPVLLGEQVDSPISAADWLQPEVSAVTLRPGRSQMVDIKVSVPANTDEGTGHYAAVTVSGEPTTISGGTVIAQSRIATLFFINAGNALPPEIVIKQVVVTTDGDVVVDYENNGKTATTNPEVEVEYVNPVTGAVIAVRKSSKCGVALPGSVARCTIPKSDIGSIQQDGLGTPLARGRVTLTSDGRTARAEQPIQWAGSWTSLILPIAGVTLIALWFRRGRRSSGDDDAEFGLPAP